MLTAAHDVSDGGVGLALTEMAMRSGIGARTWIPDRVDAFTWLFSESATRALVVVPRSEELRFTEMCGARRFPCERIGVVDSGLGDVLQIGSLELSIEQMRGISRGVLPTHF
jgi:phosphoribosylformylglycinamidine synthase